MSIIGMTGEARLPRIGSLRKGDEKPNEKQPGKDLGDELRFIGADDEITADWVAQFGSAKVDELIVRLPFATVDENWQAWMEDYVAGGLVHRCDRRTVVLQLKPDGTYDDTPRPCDGRCGAKPVGREMAASIGRAGRQAGTPQEFADLAADNPFADAAYIEATAYDAQGGL